MQGSQDQEMYTVSTITDGDGENANTPDTTDSNAYDTAEQDKLRIAAEKRRQKILDRASVRMSLVEGTLNSSTVSETKPEETSKLDIIGEESTISKIDTPAEISTDNPTTDSATATTTSASTSSKLAAMRRRRFQQKKAVPTSADIVPSSDDAKSTTESTPTENAAVVEPVKENESELIEEVTTTAAAAGTSTQTEIVIETESEANDTLENSTTTKKYLGVAKMRRRMIKERQEQQHQQQQVEVDDDPQMKSVRKSEARTSKDATLVVPKKHRSMITTLPILMYAVTTLLLFITGLHIGLQQTQINYCYHPITTGVTTNDQVDGYCYNTSNKPQWSVAVHSELAPRKMGGLQRLLSVMNVVVPTTTTSSINKMIPNEDILIEAVVSDPSNDDLESEFSTNEPTAKTLSKGNIDPLFQVDLDALTTGDGLYFTLGRFAVRMHRFILTILFYTPKSILQSIISFFWSFVQTPPILFIVALFIRHGVGKVILGAKLPKAVVDETQHKDILSTVKAFVMKFLLSSFPTVTIFYDVWTYIRSDMYVMLCGLFVGIALSHHHQAGSPYGDAGNTILNKFSTNVEIDGIADEL